MKFWCVYVADVYAGDICHQYFKSKEEAMLYMVKIKEEEGVNDWLRIEECSFRDE